jgi:hypothetical protein
MNALKSSNILLPLFFCWQENGGDMANHSAIASSVSKNYGILQCEECSLALQDTFTRLGIPGRRMKLLPINEAPWKWRNISMRNADFKLPCRSEPGEPISHNGKHYGYEVNGIIYDNIFREGIPANEWPAMFICITGDLKAVEV